MNYNEEVPDFLGEFLRPDGSKRPEVERGEVLPADVLKKVEVLLKQLLQKFIQHLQDIGGQHVAESSQKVWDFFIVIHKEFLLVK